MSDESPEGETSLFIDVEPEIVDVEELTIAGILRRMGSNMSIGTIWDKESMAYIEEIRPQSTDGLYYGIHYGRYAIGDYLAGMAVKTWTGDSEDIITRVIASGPYAAFNFSFEQRVHGGPEYAFDWLTESEYEHDPSRLMGNFDVFGKDGIPDFYIPVRKKLISEQ